MTEQSRIVSHLSPAERRLWEYLFGEPPPRAPAGGGVPWRPVPQYPGRVPPPKPRKAVPGPAAAVARPAPPERRERLFRCVCGKIGTELYWCSAGEQCGDCWRVGEIEEVNDRQLKQAVPSPEIYG